MKRNETPLNASNFLDAICSPITLTGNYALLAQSHPWLLKNISGNAKAPALFNHFIPALQSLSGYNNMIEKIREYRHLCSFKPIEKNTTTFILIIEQLIIKNWINFKTMADAKKRVNQS